MRGKLLEALEKIEPATLTSQLQQLASNMDHQDNRVRRFVVMSLGNLDVEVILQHVSMHKLGQVLQDSNLEVCEAAIETLGKFTAEEIAQTSEAVVNMFTSPSSKPSTRKAVMQSLIMKLTPDMLMTHTSALLPQLEDAGEKLESSEWSARKGAAEVMGGYLDNESL